MVLSTRVAYFCTAPVALLQSQSGNLSANVFKCLSNFIKTIDQMLSKFYQFSVNDWRFAKISPNLALGPTYVSTGRYARPQDGAGRVGGGSAYLYNTLGHPGSPSGRHYHLVTVDTPISRKFRQISRHSGVSQFASRLSGRGRSAPWI